MRNQPDLPLRAATDDDFEAISELLSEAFGEPPSEEENDRERLVFEASRCLVVSDGGRLVANAGAYTRDLTVPGQRTVPAAHVSLVAVDPMYRRRGLLGRLMSHQLHEAHANGTESVAVLWASEGRIYQRYGYGAAAPKITLEMDTRNLRLTDRAPAGGVSLRGASGADARKDLIDVFERVRLSRPGWSSRDERWWDLVLCDTPGRRGGGGPQRTVVVDTPDGPRGYALWRVKSNWVPAGPAGEVLVQELVAATPEAYTALWRFLLSVDLTRTLKYWHAALDEPLTHLVDEPRAIGVQGLRDSLWVRLVNLPAALTARGYATDLEVVLEVVDPLLPANQGRWHLVNRGGGVTCSRTDRSADLSCDVADLGAAYLGGTSVTSLAAAGRVREHRPGALAATDAAFRAARSPSSIEVF